MSILEESENRSEIHRAIAELPAIQKQIVTLFYLRDYSQKDIEEFLEIPVSMIKKHLFSARKKLRGRLEMMAETQIRSNRPSQTEAFASEVQYLLALRTGDLEAFKATVERQPDLLELRFKAPVSIPEANIKRAQRFARDITAIDKQIKVIIPEFFMTYPLE